MLEAEASRHQLGRQVFWLTARSGSNRLPGDRFSSGIGFGASPITAAALQRNCTVFPSASFSERNEAPVEMLKVYGRRGFCPLRLSNEPWIFVNGGIMGGLLSHHLASDRF
jgi:hypothetical protein